MSQKNRGIEELRERVRERLRHDDFFETQRWLDQWEKEGLDSAVQEAIAEDEVSAEEAGYTSQAHARVVGRVMEKIQRDRGALDSAMSEDDVVSLMRHRIAEHVAAEIEHTAFSQSESSNHT